LIAKGPPTFDDLYAEYGRTVLRLCRLLLADPDEADDVSQDVMLKLFHEQQSGRCRPALDRWVTRVTVNACRDRRRSGWWRWWRVRGREIEEHDVAGRVATPEQQLLGAERRRMIWDAFQTLSTRQRETFALRYVGGLTTAETAETLGITAGSAKRHLFRAVERLRTVLGGRP
jgi:RNA polymerase sigma-70 factor (ECF subfamily)